MQFWDMSQNATTFMDAYFIGIINGGNIMAQKIRITIGAFVDTSGLWKNSNKITNEDVLNSIWLRERDFGIEINHGVAADYAIKCSNIVHKELFEDKG